MTPMKAVPEHNTDRTLMECRNVQEACLADAQNGQSEEVRTHLRDCAECADFAASARQLIGCRQAAAPSPELDSRILAAARAARARRRPVLLLRLSRPILWVAAALLVAGLFASRLVIDQPGADRPQPRPSLAWEQPELEGDILALAAEMVFAELPDARTIAEDGGDDETDTAIEAGIIEIETDLLLRQLEFEGPRA